MNVFGYEPLPYVRCGESKYGFPGKVYGMQDFNPAGPEPLTWRSVRLLYRTPDWEDFVYLAITEIRHFGGTSIQVVRRLRAMLEDLVQTLPQERTDLLYLELELLKRSAQRSFLEPEDQALANVSDVQGVGGKYGPSKKDGEVETIRNHPTQNVSGEK